MVQKAPSGCVLLALGLVAYACGGAHREVTADQFTKLMQHGPDSMSAVSFLGTDGQRAYLKHWRMGVLGGETTDVCSVAIDQLPAAAEALRDGRNPWLRVPRTNDPGLRPAEQEALLRALREPPRHPVVVLLRCASGRPASVARDHFDKTFTDDDVIPVPAPRDLVLIATADEAATLHIGGTEHTLQPGRTTATWLHLRAVGPTDVVVDGAATKWTVQLRGVAAAEFHTVGFDKARSKR